ncbi:L-rhamnose-binding lectin ELEL-1-like [Mizuhopecten yessoensis]|uniref:L-rhamnose-binding lectin ELEL-1-like n=1 Tax=Mizuhopecten yessoensis TaxID=6573 RepID=UPI000B45C48E|nr:L-rhamnose-binding lectin ELEL-1-like [Mizuhopecten yessoensis]
MSLVGCGADGVLDNIQGLCQGEISCELAASNGIYGDPCPNTFKYLEVTYSCLPEPSTTVAVCELKTTTIICRPERINVISARYGRFDIVTCEHPAMSQVGCGADGVLDNIQDLCQGETSCELAASNSIYGDPCPNTFKYLEVTYSCLPER